MRTLRLLGIVLTAGLLASGAYGADFPAKPVKLIVTAAAGGGEDTEARAIAPFVEKHLGQSVVIENQPGAGGKIAFEKFQKLEPDGYTVITYTFPKSVIIEYQGKAGFRTRDFTPIFAWSRSSQLLVVNSESWRTFDEFLKAARAKPLAGGLSGRGSTTDLMGRIALDDFGIKANWVPYEGSAGSVAALAGKHLDFTICLATSAVNLIRAGRLRPLLLFSDKRDPYIPDVPIPADLGQKMTFIPTLRGVEAPPKTPAAVIKVLEDAFTKAAAEPAFIETAKKRQIVLQPVSSKEFAQAVADVYPRIARFQDVLKQ
ncbi:MAG: tripartite tricarboxylate transporter substrate binding protein [Burkholderiales bacterium]|nr:tripartite tricarboxylate transporter substrate binding protein [Burkholderiales bacterium]